MRVLRRYLFDFCWFFVHWRCAYVSCAFVGVRVDCLLDNKLVALGVLNYLITVLSIHIKSRFKVTISSMNVHIHSEEARDL